MLEKILEAAREYGLVGFVLFLMFSQALVFLRVIYMLFIRMTDTLERSSAAMSELTTYMKGRNGR